MLCPSSDYHMKLAEPGVCLWGDEEVEALRMRSSFRRRKVNKMLSNLAETHTPESKPGLATSLVSRVARYPTLVLSLLVSLSLELMQSGRVSKTRGKCWLALLYTSPLQTSGSFPQQENMALISYNCDRD